MIYINLLLIGIIITFVLDTSGFYGEFTSIISGWMTNGQIKKPIMIKPFCCSLCMTFWIGLVYIIISGGFSILNLAYLCLVAYMTPIYNDLMILLRDTITKIINKLN
jgi:hypothetical protein